MNLQQYATKEVSHKYSGNGWAVVQSMPDGFCRLVAIGKNEIGKQFFAAWDKLIKPIDDLNPEVLALVNQVRMDLESGKKIIRNTRLVVA